MSTTKTLFKLIVPSVCLIVVVVTMLTTIYASVSTPINVPNMVGYSTDANIQCTLYAQGNNGERTVSLTKDIFSECRMNNMNIGDLSVNFIGQNIIYTYTLVSPVDSEGFKFKVVKMPKSNNKVSVESYLIVNDNLFEDVEGSLTNGVAVPADSRAVLNFVIILQDNEDIAGFNAGVEFDFLSI